ncbi:MAG: hypothetical protein HGB37_00095 [Candidatus Moranbacteria bacterium]|nr:hypothetical protein [Candidatus Moranbacteria bacterium]
MKEIFENLIMPKRVRERETQNPTDSSNVPPVQRSEIEQGHESDLSRETWTRREFLKTLVAFLGGAAVLGVSGCAFEGEEDEVKDDFEIGRLPDDFWFRVITKIYERFGEDPIPMQIRAHAIIRALGIPSGQVSALTSTEAAVRTDSETDEVIAERLTNRAGVEILPEHISSSDILDLYPDGLPEELKQHLDSRIVEMFEARYEHAAEMKELYGDTEDGEIALRQENYFRLPGGVDLLSIGYTHTSKYQEIHGDYLERISRNASVIAIEGYSDVPYGEKNEEHYQGNGKGAGHYDRLMHRAVRAGFKGLFAEVDARDTRDDWEDLMEINERNPFPFMDDFYEKYLAYIRREHPALYAEIGSEDRFRKLLLLQLTGKPDKEVSHDGRTYCARRAVGSDFEYVLDPEGLEFSRILFSDALSAVKLHLIGRLMADGKISTGPILDFEGSAHLSNKSFFLRYPEYAMEVVLRTFPELISYHKFAEILAWDLEHPDWPEVVRHIAKLAFARTTDNPDRIDSFFYDYLGEYDIDPETVIPSDEEILGIMERTRRGTAIRKGEVSVENPGYSG